MSTSAFDAVDARLASGSLLLSPSCEALRDGFAKYRIGVDLGAPEGDYTGVLIERSDGSRYAILSRRGKRIEVFEVAAPRSGNHGL